ncbi:hypothetical protein EVAR_98027_1 [Eumeta japonica]|uniref:Uncharacterized protein n=1 Tax=Eumeta variegata TaxID=151549 RepID=A0A4C1ZUD6_EUMVA|nr:hypothetical protein EVAR_98027_1 [Eumeta japonica]
MTDDQREGRSSTAKNCVDRKQHQCCAARDRGRQRATYQQIWKSLGIDIDVDRAWNHKPKRSGKREGSGFKLRATLGSNRE